MVTKDEHVYLSVPGVELYGFPVRKNPGCPGLVDQGTDLAEAPSQATLGIVCDVPEKLCQAVPPVIPAGGDQIGQQGPGLSRGRKLHALLSPANFNGTQ